MTSGWTGRPCPTCRGDGEIVEDDGYPVACPACGGSGEEWGDMLENAADEYNRILDRVAVQFVGTALTSQALVALKSAVEQAQANFLGEHPDYVQERQIRVVQEPFGNVAIDAPICSRMEKLEQDHEQSEREKLIAEMEARAEIDRKREAKRMAHMLRRRRRLARKHLDKVPPNTRRIWDSLSEAQQYAILKDIDYLVRHPPGMSELPEEPVVREPEP